MIYFDLDRFKLVNDTLGHMIGDLLLSEVASRLHYVLERKMFWLGWVATNLCC